MTANQLDRLDFCERCGFELPPGSSALQCESCVERHRPNVGRFHGAAVLVNLRRAVVLTMLPDVPAAHENARLIAANG